MAAENILEDYWEDASVSWGCRGLSLSSSLPSHQAPRDGSVDPKPPYMHNFHISTSASRPRNFPPPIALCTRLSIKAGGRFVLKEMVSLPSHSFRAEREQGRLCLHLIEPKDLDEDKEDDYDMHDNVCNVEDNVCNAEDTVVCAHLHQQEQQDAAELDINKNFESHEPEKHDPIQGVLQELGEAVLEETEDMPEKHAHAGVSSDAIKHIETRDNSTGACMPNIVCTNEIKIKNKGGAYMGALGISQHQRTCLWSKEGSNDAADSLSPTCSSKQGLSHQSFARTSPALGLAVS